MTPITTVRAQLPCPTCGVVGPLTAALQTSSPATELIELRSDSSLPPGTQPGVVSECKACWSRRADGIAAARRRLQAAGELTSLGPGREDAWLGVPVSRCEEDYECAFVSALMKTAEGASLPAPPRLESLDVATLRDEAPEHEPELAKV